MPYEKKEIYIDENNNPCAKSSAQSILVSAISARVHPYIEVFSKNNVRFTVTYTLDGGDTITQLIPIDFFEYFLPYLINGVYEGLLVPATETKSSYIGYLIPHENKLDKLDSSSLGKSRVLHKLVVGNQYTLPCGSTVIYLGDSYFASTWGYLNGRGWENTTWTKYKLGYVLKRNTNSIKFIKEETSAVSMEDINYTRLKAGVKPTP